MCWDNVLTENTQQGIFDLETKESNEISICWGRRPTNWATKPRLFFRHNLTNPCWNSSKDLESDKQRLQFMVKSALLDQKQHACNFFDRKTFQLCKLGDQSLEPFAINMNWKWHRRHNLKIFKLKLNVDRQLSSNMQLKPVFWPTGINSFELF